MMEIVICNKCGEKYVSEYHEHDKYCPVVMKEKADSLQKEYPSAYDNPVFRQPRSDDDGI